MEHLRNGYVISDLHLFTNRTDADNYLDIIVAQASSADFIVLNGDIFDFKWTTLEDLVSTVHAAAGWLKDFCLKCGSCEVFYVMGNHDGIVEFEPLLEELAENIPNFRWAPAYVKIGDCLFMHGDLPLKIRCHDPLVRKLKTDEALHSQVQHHWYEILIFSRLHVLSSLMQWRRLIAKKINHSLQKHHPEIASQIKHIYFGHVHKSFENFKYRGLYFHNTGSMVRHLKSAVLNPKPNHSNNHAPANLLRERV